MNMTITGYKETTGELQVPESTTVDELRQDLAKVLGYKRDASGTARFFVLQRWEAELVMAIGRNTPVTNQELGLLSALRAANTGNRSDASRAQFHSIPDLIAQRYVAPDAPAAGLHRTGASLVRKGLARKNVTGGRVHYAITDFGLAAWGQGVQDAGLTTARRDYPALSGLVEAFDAERERIEADAETRVSADEQRFPDDAGRGPRDKAIICPFHGPQAGITCPVCLTGERPSLAAATAYDPAVMAREIIAWAGTDPHRRAFLADVLGAVSFDGPADGERAGWDEQAD